ncbi:NTP transferase domain-containing protein [Aliihoeflea aestuarii]|jgi:N-acetyl-alpha-D-muramate 1-phosphate uridylyltransferase|uniref:nucleotidyltransferase family protein n=1 Tax=Aliihoeflea aestuarii TaxID=453840 RepID=UPI002092B4E4|nr:nucleotidyltransferase family protein [Aliihoeflea aestuarii]MCO6390989.1 NTP transferase domain-containing protein [Aliihoeflea aestuarii]
MNPANMSAMVLAAGLGTRMRPITDTLPKPLVTVAGRTLLDRSLDALEAVGVGRAVVNVHHLADQIVTHCASRVTPEIVISDEREELLDSAGGIVKSLPLLGDAPFFLLNADTFWIDRGEANLAALADAWDASRMDMLLMLVPVSDTTGHGTKTDFCRDADGRLDRARGNRQGFVYAGAAILDPGIFSDATATPHSLNLYFDRAIERGRLFGHVMDGHWITVGTPEAIGEAERAVERFGSQAS